MVLLSAKMTDRVIFLPIFFCMMVSDFFSESCILLEPFIIGLSSILSLWLAMWHTEAVLAVLILFRLLCLSLIHSCDKEAFSNLYEFFGFTLSIDL